MRGDRKRKSIQGLTLIELMVVLTVMGVMIGAALPTMSEALADRRVSMIARDVVGLFRRARYMSMAYGRAHRIGYTNDAGAGLALQAFGFETIRGTGGACFKSGFGNTAGVWIADFDCGANWRCVDHVYANTYDPVPGDNDFVRVDGWNWQTFCYESGANNQVFVNALLVTNWLTTSAQAGRGFVVYRQLDGDAIGVSRKILVPFGTGAPRIMR